MLSYIYALLSEDAAEDPNMMESDENGHKLATVVQDPLDVIADSEESAMKPASGKRKLRRPVRFVDEYPPEFDESMAEEYQPEFDEPMLKKASRKKGDNFIDGDEQTAPRMAGTAKEMTRWIQVLLVMITLMRMKLVRMRHV